MKGERIAIICLTAGLITVGATTYTRKEIKQVEVVQEYQENNLELEKSIKEEISKVGRIEVLQMQVSKKATIIADNIISKYCNQETKEITTQTGEKFNILINYK